MRIRHGVPLALAVPPYQTLWGRLDCYPFVGLSVKILTANDFECNLKIVPLAQLIVTFWRNLTSDFASTRKDAQFELRSSTRVRKAIPIEVRPPPSERTG